MTIEQTASAVAILAATTLFLPASADAGGRPLTDWVGSWSLGSEQTIDISLEEGSSLVVDGYATYGARDPERVAQGSVQVASFFARITRDQVEAGEVIRFTIDGDTVLPFAVADGSLCKVELKLEWPKLRARDNGRCGGANVSFIGLYAAPYKK